MKNFSSFSEVHFGLQNAEFSVEDLVQYYLQNIENHKHLNAFLEVFSQESIENAKQIDLKIKAGTAGRLAGMVIGIKDVICYKNHRLSGGSKILEGFESQFTATALQRLLDEDAIVIGRQNCDEFAMGSSNENSAFGPVKNAADPSRVPGGSSGGSAVSVQADLSFASIASDTGGSIRQPAAFCGNVGLKPTYSRVSRYGLIGYGSSFDSIGPIARSVEDAGLLLEIMAGYDEMDSTSATNPVEAYGSFESDNEKFNIAYLKDVLDSPAIQPEIKEAFLKSIKQLESQGHSVEAVEVPHLDYVLPTYYILTTSEASTNLSRYDGIRYGHRSEKAKTLEEVYKMSRSEGFGKEVQKRILLGTFALSADYHDAYFNRAQKVRRLIFESAGAIFSKHDFLLMPTTPTTAFKIGDKTQDPLAMYFADIFTVWANLAGVAAINIPFGTDNNGMPIGLQAHAKAFDDKRLLAFAQTWNSGF